MASINQALTQFSKNQLLKIISITKDDVYSLPTAFSPVVIDVSRDVSWRHYTTIYEFI